MLARIYVLALMTAMAAGHATAAQQQRPAPRYQGQFAQDFEAGRAPTDAEIAEAERAAAAAPGDFQSVRRLGKGYFFQFFGAGRLDAVPKARATLARALELRSDDAETLAYLGGLEALAARRAKDPDARKAGFDRALPLLERAGTLAPTHAGVLAITGGSYLFFPDSYNVASRAAEAMERIRARMGPMFSRFSHHGQQRVLLTQGQAYARMGRADEARTCLEAGLAVNPTSVEGELIQAELDTLAARPAPRHE